MSTKPEPYEAIIAVIKILSIEFKDKRTGAEYRYSLQRSILALLETLAFFTTDGARLYIQQSAEELKKMILTDPEYDDEVSMLLQELAQEPSSDPSVELVKKISTIPPPPDPQGYR